MPDKKPPEKDAKRRAVIVGTNYKDAKGGIPPLKGAEDDAREIYQRLSDPNIGSFDIPKNHCLIGVDAKSEDIRRAVSDVFYDTAASCDLALFYFSGHGFNDKWYSDLYIAPYDMDKKQPFVKGIKKSELCQVISKAVSSNLVKCALVVLDCCYSGLDTNFGDRGPEKTFDSHIKEFSSEAEGLLVIGSSGEEETAKETEFTHKDGTKHTHGAFSYWLINGLDCLTGSNGMIHFKELWDHVEEESQSEETKKKNITQKPTISDIKRLSGFGSIEIAISVTHWYEKLQPQLDKAAACKDSGEPFLYIDAASIVHEILGISPKQPRALEVQGYIIKGLEDCRTAVRSWLVNNRGVIKGWLSPQEIPRILPKLEKLAVEFPDFDKVAKSSMEDKDMLGNTCDFALGKMDEEMYKLFLKEHAAKLSSTAGEGPKERQVPETKTKPATISDEFK